MQPIARNRINSIDILRGAVMIIMALDHCRDMFYYGSTIDQDPLSLTDPHPAIFFTRWITHYCAPVFIFLSGTSVFLYTNKGRSKNQVFKFLFTRGLWLMFAEIFVIGVLWDFNFIQIFLQVIWAIGLCMVFLSVLQYLPYRILLTIGLVIVFGHNLLDNITVEIPFLKSLAWSIIHVEKSFQLSGHLLLVVHYPFLPWLGLMIIGFCAGKLFVEPTSQETRRRFFLYGGISSILLFIIFRLINVYGDIHPWSVQTNILYSVMSFINTNKYPPSLDFMLMTIGPAMVLLSVLENKETRITKKLIVFGKVPFFFYLLHVPLIHIIAWLIFFSTGHHWSDLDFSHYRSASLPVGSGQPLWVVYLGWVVTIFILYFPCKWYGRYKATHRYWWLSYI